MVAIKFDPNIRTIFQKLLPIEHPVPFSELLRNILGSISIMVIIYS